MTANEFLGQLEQSLSGLSSEERENAMSYYREYFMEAGEENEDDAAAKLGSPQSVAQRIISEMGEGGMVLYSEEQQNAQQEAQKEPSTGRYAVGALVLVLGFPIWITILSLLFAFIVTIAVIVGSFAFAAVAAPIQGIIDIASGCIGSGIYGIGSGIFLAGLVMLLWKPAYLLAVNSVKLLWKLLCKLFGRRTKL